MEVWRKVEEILRNTARDYGFREIRTPVIEHTELFHRGVGDTTDIVQKEMYSFEDKAGRSISLRPELTASAARAYVEHGMKNLPQPVKLFYIGPNFRYENPQAGRYRQHHQFGVEIFGAASSEAEVEIISIGADLIERLGIGGVALYVNSIGCPECRGAYKAELAKFLSEKMDSLCGTCRQRFERNPLRILDCKTDECKRLLGSAPSMLDSLDEDCRAHFDGVLKTLSLLGIGCQVNPRIVRGLDYYTRTVFEFVESGGSGLTVIGGGRYDGLIGEVGGPPTPGAGFGMGIERLVLNMQNGADSAETAEGPAIFFANAGEPGLGKARALTFALRKAGVSAEYDLLGRSVKAQMKYADKINAARSVVIGDDELEKNEASVRNMRTGESSQIKINDISEIIRLTKS